MAVAISSLADRHFDAAFGTETHAVVENVDLSDVASQNLARGIRYEPTRAIPFRRLLRAAHIPPAGSFVDLASLDTGIGKRNQHMRDNHLETDKYPKATFVGATVLEPKGTTLAPGKPVAFECEGDFTLHGVTKRLRASVEVTLRDERTLAFKTSFKVPLADYKIDRPKFLFLKLGEVQDVTVEGVAIATP